MSRWFAPGFALSALALYWLAVTVQEATLLEQHQRSAEIVVTEPLQVLLYGGDRFLAANIESIRAAASATDNAAQGFRLRAHLAASRLNPCHEDNYWIGNASLSWGGAEEQGFQLLRNAMHCRFWDEWPPFFYGFNQHFFYDNTAEARRAVEMAAKRSAENAAIFRTFSTMLAAGKISDTRLAIKLIERDRDTARDPALREMLNKRVIRLNGLLTLREAQATYEKRYHTRLEKPQQLISSGILQQYPQDPMQLGYEYRDHTFHLRQMKFE